MPRTHLIFVLSTLSLGVTAAANGAGIQPYGITVSPLQQLQFTIAGYVESVTWSVQPAGMGTITSTGLYTAPASSGVAYIYAQATYGGSTFVNPIYVSNASQTTNGSGPSAGGNGPTYPGGVSSGSSPGSSPTNPSAPTAGPLPANPTSSPAAGPSPSGPGPAPAQPAAPSGPAQGGITVSVTPPSMNLQANQSASFAALVQGTADQQVQWSLSPNVGSLVNGRYTAPAWFGSESQITIFATSVADPTQTATATVLLLAPVSSPSPLPQATVSLSPSTALLDGGQTATFTPVITGISNAAVSWSFSPQVGTLNNGVYQAPALVASAQTVTITATSVSETTLKATAVVSLQPVGVTVGPASVSLAAGKSATFAASVTGTGNSAVTWSLNPAVGSVTNGVYTAPATIGSSQTVTITATSAANPAKAASATISLTPAVTVAPPSSVTLPLEVIGPNGTMVSAAVTIPSGSNLSGQLQLLMTIHGLRSQTQASVQVNNSAWLPISTPNVTLLGNAAVYGGIGGGFHTIQMTMNLPAGAITSGTNTITFRFNQTDGRVSGFRVLAFNVLAASGSALIPSSTFVSEDPNTWQPPSTAASDIAAGQTLWNSAPLTVPLTTGGTQPILAHCSDCHAQDGRDLKYFNYSNNSIETRALFHGLTAQQGMQIASYIRSLNAPNPGLPWNPPYQPGPGLDSLPVSQWSAGAGLGAVLARDQDLVSELFPSGPQASNFSPTGVLNIRETQIPLQLPDWNSWLPTIHPMDAWPDFLTSDTNTRYSEIRSILVPGSPSAYLAALGDIQAWGGDYLDFIIPKEPSTASTWTPTYVNQVYSTPLWLMVKNWELNQEFQLEGMAKTVFTNPLAESRAWYSEFPFLSSPNMLHIPQGSAGLDNGTDQTWTYLALIWYHTQLILNNSEYQQNQNSPIDWGYVYAFVKELSQTDSAPQAGMLNLWMIKGLQISNNGIGPNTLGTGWNALIADLSRQVSPSETSVWTGMPAATRTAISNGMVQGWLTEVQQFTPAQFNASGFSPTRVPVPNEPDSSNFEDRVWYMIPQFRYLGVNQTLINELAAWAQSVWPVGNWAATATATCAPNAGQPTVIYCSTD